MSTDSAGSPRVLIVVEKSDTAADLSGELRASGYEVCAAVATGDEAVAAAARERPTVVLMDVWLAGGEDGIETARRIKQGHDAAIVFLASQADDATVTRALDVSPVGYLMRPFQAQELRVTIELALANHARGAATTKDLLALATTDALTGLANRRQLDASLDAEWVRCRQHRSSLAVVIIDIDHFKAVNDAGGHRAGDECLQRIAAIVRDACHAPGTVIGRWGGEEFLAIVADANLERGLAVADRIVHRVREACLPHPSRPLGIVTVSVGVAAAVPAGSSPEALVELADRGLYAAKHAGRDRAATAAE